VVASRKLDAAGGRALLRELGLELGNLRLGILQGRIKQQGALHDQVSRIGLAHKRAGNHRLGFFILGPCLRLGKLLQEGGQLLAFLHVHRELRFEIKGGNSNAASPPKVQGLPCRYTWKSSTLSWMACTFQEDASSFHHL